MLKSRHTEDSVIEVGIDEAGRGCLWGPLIAAAVCLPAEATWPEEDRKMWAMVKDSKKVTPKRRAALEAFLQEKAMAIGIGRVEPAEIDTLGMTRANQLAFERAYVATGVQAGRLLIDGILSLPSCNVEQVVEAEADGKYLAVAAASIVAKETRDRWVLEQCEADSQLDEKYGLRSSKGYGTAKHRAGVTTHGMHSLHRRLFLRKLLGYEVCVINDE